MSYVPSHLEYKPRQYDGWPVGVTPEGKAWATETVKTLLDCYLALPLDTARFILFEAPDRPDEFRNKALLDYQYAVADRALRAADGDQVWVPSRPYTRRVFRFIGPSTITDPLESPAAKDYLSKVDSAFSREQVNDFHEWVDRSQFGDVFLLPGQSVSVVCSDKNQKPRSFKEPS